jgi:hypothetical protein
MAADRRCSWADCPRKADRYSSCRFHEALSFLEEAERLTAVARKHIEALMQEDDERREVTR